MNVKKDVEYTMKVNYNYFTGIGWYHDTFEQFVNEFNNAAKRYAEGR